MSHKLYPICPNGHTPDHFIAPFPVVSDVVTGELLFSNGLDIPHGAIHPDGEVCNSYYGGLYGVSAEDRAMIEEVESVYFPECIAEAKWQH